MATTIVITRDIAGYAWYNTNTVIYGNYTHVDMLIGLLGVAKFRGWATFSLDTLPETLPAGYEITNVKMRGYVNLAGDASHLGDIHPYGGDGQADPATDDGETAYNRCVAGSLYVNDTTAFRVLGWTQWFDLGSQACIDVKNAKDAVNRFSLGIHEEGDDASLAKIDGSLTASYPVELEITYGVVLPPEFKAHQFPIRRRRKKRIEIKSKPEIATTEIYELYNLFQVVIGD